MLDHRTRNRRISAAIHSLALATAALSCATASDLASAQDDADAAATTEPQLGQVLVTARKTVERQQDVPVAVTVLDGSFLTDHGIRDIRESARFVPSFSFRTDHSQRAFTGFRGIGAQGGGSQPSLAVFVDGVYQPGAQFFSQPLFDVERIEFLKGPQGTLYGRNTLGGAINIVTQAPRDDWGGTFEVGGGNAETWSARASINAPIAERAVLRLSGLHEESDGFTRSTERDEWASFRSVDALRASLLLTPGENFQATFSGYYSDQRNGANTYAVVQETDQYVRQFRGNERPLTDFHSYGAALRASYSFAPDLELTSISSYDRMITEAAVFDTDYSPAPLQRFDTEPNPRSYAQELRLASDDDSIVDWLVGLYWSRENPVTNASFVLNGALVQLSRQEVEIETRAAFANLSLRPSEHWELVAGLRYDDVTLEQEILQRNQPPSATNPFRADGAESELQPKLSATYFFNTDFMVYASAARGYRGGGFNSAFVPPSQRTFDPEVTLNYELGTKSSFWGRRAALSLAVYFIEQDDAQVAQIVTGTSGQPTNATTNAGELESKGIELEGAFLPFGGLTVNAAFSYNDTEIVASPNPALVGTRPNSTERMRGVLGLNYERSLTDSLEAFGGLTYTGAGPISFNNGVDEQPYYELVDLQAGLRISDQYEIQAYANNVFDKDYQVIYSFVQILNATGDLSLLGDRRTYGVRLTAKW